MTMSVYRPARVGARPARNQAACSRAASARSGRSSRRVPGKTLTGSPGASGVSRPFSAIATADVSSGTRTFRDRCSCTPASVTATATRAAIQQSASSEREPSSEQEGSFRHWTSSARREWSAARPHRSPAA